MNVAIVTFGCSLNQSDSELMAGLLEKHGFSITDKEKADLILINSCTVKELAEQKLYREIREAEKLGKKVVIAGCVPQADRTLEKSTLKNYSIIGTSQLNHVAEVIEETLQGNTVHLLSKKQNPRLNLPKIRKNPIVEIIPINEGCLGSCTYCKTIHARGRLKSYEPEAIKEQMQAAVDDGCKEIWITSQDTAAYGLDIDWTLPKLLKLLLTVRGDYKIRVGMGNPEHIKKYVDELLEVLAHPKMFKFLHIPVQAGNNRVLKEMNRPYIVEEYEEIIAAVRKKDPKITIATDIIVAFPGETEEEFLDTIKNVERTKPDVVNMSRYWPRPNTPAARMKQISSKIAKERIKQLKETVIKIQLERNQQWMNWQGKVLIDEQGKNNTMVGRNDYYRPIIIKKSCSIGSVELVTIKEITAIDLRSGS